MNPAPAKMALDGGPSKLSPFSLNSPKSRGSTGRRRRRPRCHAGRPRCRAARPCGAPRRSRWRSWAPAATCPEAPRRPCSRSPCRCRTHGRCRPGGSPGTGRSPGRTRPRNRSRRGRRRRWDATPPVRSRAGDRGRRAGTTGSRPRRRRLSAPPPLPHPRRHRRPHARCPGSAGPAAARPGTLPTVAEPGSRALLRSAGSRARSNYSGRVGSRGTVRSSGGRRRWPR
jgi:hypothetical protein